MTLNREINRELIDDVETALRNVLANILPNGSFTITKSERDGRVSMTLTLDSDIYPRFVTLRQGDVHPLKGHRL